MKELAPSAPWEPNPAGSQARRQTLHACRQFYAGVDGVIRGLNAADPDGAVAGLRQINAGTRTLRTAARLVDAAPTTVQ